MDGMGWDALDKTTALWVWVAELLWCERNEPNKSNIKIAVGAWLGVFRKKRVAFFAKYTPGGKIPTPWHASKCFFCNSAMRIPLRKICTYSQQQRKSIATAVKAPSTPRLQEL